MGANYCLELKDCNLYVPAGLLGRYEPVWKITITGRNVNEFRRDEFRRDELRRDEFGRDDFRRDDFRRDDFRRDEFEI